MHHHVPKERIAGIESDVQDAMVVHIGNPLAGICPIIRRKSMLGQKCCGTDFDNPYPSFRDAIRGRIIPGSGGLADAMRTQQLAHASR